MKSLYSIAVLLIVVILLFIFWPASILILIVWIIYLRTDRAKQRSAVSALQNITAGSLNRTIPSNVKQHVWQRDGGRCVECGSNERA